MAKKQEEERSDLLNALRRAASRIPRTHVSDTTMEYLNGEKFPALNITIFVGFKSGREPDFIGLTAWEPEPSALMIVKVPLMGNDQEAHKWSFPPEMIGYILKYLDEFNARNRFAQAELRPDGILTITWGCVFDFVNEDQLRNVLLDFMTSVVDVESHLLRAVAGDLDPIIAYFLDTQRHQTTLSFRSQGSKTTNDAVEDAGK